ncbi:catenin alpha-2, partial [Eurytemora carolleeae]|uniref:catenin alpha-2 n=1 Tax=Eurytemora carolleeae TaxID=1294199 RepID=UPI000C767DD9
MVYDGVREVRRIVSIYNSEESVQNASWEMIEYDQEEEQKEEMKEKPSIRDAVNKIPEQEKLEIAKELEITDHVYWVAIWSNPRVRNLLQTSHIGGSQVDGFHEEKAEFDKEVEKWEDSENDIVLLAKQMCRIMMDMTDFIKGKGPIKSTQDIITSAKKISEHGKKLDTLARRIADMCPESSTKNDLLAYLQRIALYCHQLNITSKVKADVHNVSGEFIVSGLDSACSLIQAARNLMNAVVLTVKASYVASRMYRSNQIQSGAALSQIVVWKMKTPEKLPLVKRELPEVIFLLLLLLLLSLYYSYSYS